MERLEAGSIHGQRGLEMAVNLTPHSPLSTEAERGKWLRFCKAPLRFGEGWG